MKRVRKVLEVSRSEQDARAPRSDWCPPPPSPKGTLERSLEPSKSREKLRVKSKRLRICGGAVSHRRVELHFSSYSQSMEWCGLLLLSLSSARKTSTSSLFLRL